MQATAELFEPGEYLNTNDTGYFAICGKPAGRWQQQHHEVSQLHTVIDGLNPHLDTWISQATFERPNRRAVNLHHIALLFADLDTYHIPDLARRKPDEQAKLLVSYCLHNNIPAPSVVLFSGRGLQPKWILSEPLARERAIEWTRVEAALVTALSDFGADQNAKDLARVLRVDRTVNTKSGEYCRVVYVHSGVDNVATRYDFDEIAELFNVSGEQERPRTAPSRSRQSNILQLPEGFNLRRLNWYRLEDLRTLWRLRGGVPEGHRESTLFWQLNFLMKAAPGKVSEFWNEAQALAAEIDTEHFYYKSDLSTLYQRAKEQNVYTPRNQTLINRYEITPDEERQLRTIISYSEKQRRRTEKRRAEGVRPQSESVERMQPWQELGISRRTYYWRKKHGRL